MRNTVYAGFTKTSGCYWSSSKSGSERMKWHGHVSLCVSTSLWSLFHLTRKTVSESYLVWLEWNFYSVLMWEQRSVSLSQPGESVGTSLLYVHAVKWKPGLVAEWWDPEACGAWPSGLWVQGMWEVQRWERKDGRPLEAKDWDTTCPTRSLWQEALAQPTAPTLLLLSPEPQPDPTAVCFTTLNHC